MDTSNIYLFKALDAYPFNLEEAVESLNYALSYNEKDTEALILMGNIYGFQLQNYKKAIGYYSEAMAVEVENPKVYPNYAYMLICCEEYKEAQKLLDFALTVKGTDKAVLHQINGQLFEKQMRYKQAIKAFKKAQKLGGNNDFIEFVKQEKQRVKDKMPNKKKKKKRSKKQKRKEKKKNRSKK